MNKFYIIFAFLFGVGAAIFVTNAEHAGDRPAVRMSRRLLVLAVFGCAHVVCVWWGDILLAYAVLGFFLLWLLLRFSA